MTEEGYLAKLGIDTGDFDGAINKVISTLSELADAFPQVSKVTDRAEASLLNVAGAGEKAAGGVQAANTAATQGSAQWKKYVQALQDANQAYRKFKQGQVTGEGGGTNISGISRAGQDKLLATEDASRASVTRAIRDQRNEEAAAARERQSFLDRDLADSEMLRRAQQNRVDSIRMAERMAANERRQAAMAANASRAGAFSAGGIDSRLGQASTGQRASDTGFAQLMVAQQRQEAAAAAGALAKQNAETTKLASAERDLAAASATLASAQARVNAAMGSSDIREQVAATNAAANAQEAQTRATQGMIQAKDAEYAALSRTRYALYDISQIAAVTSVASLAATTAIAGTAIAYEQQFANVRRTVGVTGEAADELYSQFLRLSTQIPTSFSDLAQIGTLAGQLGVAESRVASFTQTVAQFSATTDVSVDASATAFGRLDALLGDVGGRYDRLASSVLNVGINSVATESEIVSIANQIAAAAQGAGLAASEVVGLSSALASLGVRPEAARGTILRVFSEINSAVSAGGEDLENYARISGMTAQQFRSSWGSDFTTTFLGFLRGIGEEGTNAEQTIQDLGITATRDRNALLRLAQNTDVVSESLALASEGFNDTTILAENFGVIAQTNAAKLQVLGQTVGAFFATLGNGASGPLSQFLDTLQRTTEGLIRFAETPVGQWVGTATIALTALVGVMGLLAAVTLRGVGGWLAIRTAMGSATAQAWLAAGGIKGLSAQLLGAAGAAGVFAAALKATGIGLLVTGGLWLLGEAIDGISQSMRSSQQVAEDYFGTIDGFGAALAADNPVLQAHEVATRANGEAAAGAAQDLDEMVLAIAAQRAEIEASQAAFNASGQALGDYTLRVGENTRAWVQNALLQSEAFQQMISNAQGMQTLMGGSYTNGLGTTVAVEPFSMEGLLQSAIDGGAEGAEAYKEAFLIRLTQAFAAANPDDFYPTISVAEALGGQEAVDQLDELATAVGGVVDGATQMSAASEYASLLGDSLFGAADAADEFGASADQMGADAWNSASNLTALIDQAYGATNASRELQNSVYALGAEFANSGGQVAFSGQAMQQVIQNIVGSSANAQVAAANLQGFFNSLIQGGYATAQQLSQLSTVIANLTGGRAISVPIPKFNPAPFVAGLNSVRKAATGRGGGGGGGGKKKGGGGGGGGGAAGAIRTLIDYANDLQKVFSRAFQIRFGSQQALDKVTDQWREMREETEDARKTIIDATKDMNDALREHAATAQQLLSDKAIAKYWLSVAESYGDTLRAGELRAQLAKIEDDLADSARGSADAQSKGAQEIADAQKTLNRGLVGNGEAAIDNRDKLLDLVSGYQDYLNELAASGLSQDELKKRTADLKAEFLRQATQLGYNSSELGVYSKAFDDVRVAIDRVPRNITVKANANPALQALNEFLARARNARPTTTLGVSTPGTGAMRGLGNAQGAAYAQGWIWATSNTRRIIKRAANVPGGYAYRHAGNTVEFFRKGGYTGNGPANEVAGLTHRREFVLNERGAQMFPREALEAANQGRAPVSPTVTLGGGGGGSSLDSRFAELQVQLLAEIRDNIGTTLVGGALQRSVNVENEVGSRLGR